MPWASLSDPTPVLSRGNTSFFSASACSGSHFLSEKLLCLRAEAAVLNVVVDESSHLGVRFNVPWMVLFVSAFASMLGPGLSFAGLVLTFLTPQRYRYKVLECSYNIKSHNVN